MHQVLRGLDASDISAGTNEQPRALLGNGGHRASYICSSRFQRGGALRRSSIDLRSIFGRSLFLKCEGFNFAGSINLKAATEMVEAAARDRVLTPRSVLVESSSGNLGVALSVIAASKGYQFLCVTDSRCNLATRRLMEVFGSQVHMIAEPHPERGFLGARLDYVRGLCASDDRYVWLNQHANPNNWRAHHRTTAAA